MPLGDAREKGCCCFPGKCVGVVIEKDMRGEDVKSVCSFGRGVKGGREEGESMTQLFDAVSDRTSPGLLSM